MTPLEVMLGTLLFGLGIFAIMLLANRRLRQMRANKHDFTPPDRASEARTAYR
jgi:hypothetical protein